MGKIIGIDLGTTNSCVAVVEGGEPTVVPNAEGSRTTSSVVGFSKDGERLVGATAKRQSVTNPEATVYSVKRFMGRRFDEVPDERTRMPYSVVEGSNGQVSIGIGDKSHSPPEISAAVLQKMKQTAEDYLGETVDEAVITVPAYFNDSQRQATKDAGQASPVSTLSASSTNRRQLHWPTDSTRRATRRSRCSISAAELSTSSILEIGDGVFEVKATNGDTHLGGDDLDHAVVDFLADEFKKEAGHRPTVRPPWPSSG